MRDREQLPCQPSGQDQEASRVDVAAQEFYARVRAVGDATRLLASTLDPRLGAADQSPVDLPDSEDPGLDADLADWRRAGCLRPRVAVLGPVRVDAPGQPPTERRRFYAEVVAYLALRGPRGASPAQLEAAIWPGRQISASGRRVVMTRVRRWLGADADGRAWLPPAMPQRRYRLRAGYLLDWYLFCRLLHRAAGHTGERAAADLRQALRLIRGPAFHTGHRPAGSRTAYGWLPAHLHPRQLAALITDTGERAARLWLAAGDARTALWALRQAAVADPDDPDTSRPPSGDPEQPAGTGHQPKRGQR